MPHTNSAKKRLRQNDRRRADNRAMRSQLRTVLRKAREAAAAGAPAEAATKQVLRTAFSALDKAARKGLIKKNEADRRKARLALLLNRSAAAKK